MPKINQATYLEDRKHVKSQNWKCEKSPNGAHAYVWKGENPVGKCKYCKIKHKPPPPLSDKWMAGLNETMRTFNIKRFQAL